MNDYYTYPTSMIAALLLLAAPTLSNAARPAAEAVPDSNLERVDAMLERASAAMQNLPAGAPEIRVGPSGDPDCDFFSIQAAVDSIPNGGDGTIRISSGTYNENVFILDKNVGLIGGHATCSEPTPVGLSTTFISATDTGQPAISYVVQGTGEPAGFTRELRVTNIFVTGGSGSMDFLPLPGGGINVLTFADRVANVFLNTTEVAGNSSEFQGGGIALIGSGRGQLWLGNDSRIHDNEVTGDEPHGGGLYCQGDYEVIMIGGSIHSNTAGEEGLSTGRGGGVYLDGCTMAWVSDTPFRAGDEAALRNNTVYGNGGGLYATGGAEAFLRGADFTLPPSDPSSSRPLRIHDNTATEETAGAAADGSAVYAIGAGTQVVFDRAWTYANEAIGGDAGNTFGDATFYGLGGAEIIVERGSETCHTPRNCSRVFDNNADNRGVAFALGDATTIRFRRTIVSGNDASDLLVVSSLFESQNGGTIEVDDTLVFGNSADWGFVTWASSSPATTRVLGSTVADNDFSREVFRILEEDASFFLYDSIIHEPGTDMAIIENNPDIRVDCVVWHDDQLAEFEEFSGEDRTMVADPMFLDPPAGLFYLQSGSPAINYCDVPPPDPAVDLDWSPRGISHSGQPNLHGPYDLGAYEVPLAIFNDRFEESM